MRRLGSGTWAAISRRPRTALRSGSAHAEQRQASPASRRGPAVPAGPASRDADAITLRLGGARNKPRRRSLCRAARAGDDGVRSDTGRLEALPGSPALGACQAAERRSIRRQEYRSHSWCGPQQYNRRCCIAGKPSSGAAGETSIVSAFGSERRVVCRCRAGRSCRRHAHRQQPALPAPPSPRRGVIRQWLDCTAPAVTSVSAPPRANASATRLELASCAAGRPSMSSRQGRSPGP